MARKLWVNEERTVFVETWADMEVAPETLQVATRPEPGATWGPPTLCTLEHDPLR